MFLDLFQPVGLLMLKPSSVNIIPRPFNIIGLGTPGREGNQHPIVQAIHGCFTAQGRAHIPSFGLRRFVAAPLGVAISRVQASLHRRRR